MGVAAKEFRTQERYRIVINRMDEFSSREYKMRVKLEKSGFKVWRFNL